MNLVFCSLWLVCEGLVWDVSMTSLEELMLDKFRDDGELMLSKDIMSRSGIT